MNKRSIPEEKTQPANKWSQASMRLWVNKCPQELSKAIIGNTPSLGMYSPRLRWVSPLKSRKYAEYCDEGFLRAIGHPELKDKLYDFWPTRGLHWDALAVVESEDGKDRIGVVLVEAKSQPKELYCDRTDAKGEVLLKEKKALHQTAHNFLKMGYTRARQFGDGPLYDYGRRLAHLYFLNKLADVPAWLVNIYFNPQPITDRNPWDVFIPYDLKRALGVENNRMPQVSELFMPAKP